MLADLGLVRTRLTGCCADLFAPVVSDLGGAPEADLEALRGGATPEQLDKLSVRDPERCPESATKQAW